ncbi:hypothetical protein G7Y89_g9467 [Cudoniella acicularis]|uniref:Uncharacterized protein n=1 Tax=Cudoniella acicularis TaxID=354080 RepID=A0A8H4REL2_9HELO|nr:hypothetical protein G7Y89_g9467 [Cudoniella acicularis]
MIPPELREKIFINVFKSPTGYITFDFNRDEDSIIIGFLIIPCDSEGNFTSMTTKEPASSSANFGVDIGPGSGCSDGSTATISAHQSLDPIQHERSVPSKLLASHYFPHREPPHPPRELPNILKPLCTLPLRRTLPTGNQREYGVNWVTWRASTSEGGVTWSSNFALDLVYGIGNDLRGIQQRRAPDLPDPLYAT